MRFGSQSAWDGQVYTEQKSKSESNTGNNPKTSQEDDKVFDKIVDLFDGEIIH